MKNRTLIQMTTSHLPINKRQIVDQHPKDQMRIEIAKMIAMSTPTPTNTIPHTKITIMIHQLTIQLKRKSITKMRTTKIRSLSSKMKEKKTSQISLLKPQLMLWWMIREINKTIYPLIMSWDAQIKTQLRNLELPKKILKALFQWWMEILRDQVTTLQPHQ